MLTPAGHAATTLAPHRNTPPSRAHDASTSAPDSALASTTGSGRCSVHPASAAESAPAHDTERSPRRTAEEDEAEKKKGRTTSRSLIRLSGRVASEACGKTSLVSGGTLVSLFLGTAHARAPAAALRTKRGGAWTAVSWAEWERRSRAIAAELVAWGVEPGDRVAIFGSTREEWVVLDLAVLMAGAATVPIYPSLVGEQAAYILRDSGAKVLFAEDATYVKRLADHDAGVLAGLAKTVLFDALPAAFGAPGGELGPDPALAAQVDARIAAGTPDDLATIVYTSGTTGPPKGVMLAHSSLVFDTAALSEVIQVGPADEQLLFLPLAHIFGKMLVMTQYRAGYATSFAQSIAKVLDDAAEVNPTFLGAVPRVFEKVFAVANERAAAAGGLRLRLFTWATAVGRSKQGGWGRAWADRLVLSKIRARFGTRLRFAISGGAPLAKELAEWFDGAGIRILEAYGLTETTGGTTINAPAEQRYGTVGRALRGIDVRIAGDGEVLVRGPSVMRGYWRKPEETRAVIDAEGWFHTGDIGELDAQGFLRITDRKKDIIVTAGGKNVAPQNIENLLKQSPWVSQAMVHGDKRPYLVALLTLNADTVARYARENGVDGGAVAGALASHPGVRAEVQREVDAVNARLSSFETVKRFAIVARDFSVEGGELTPTLKVKRQWVSERHRDLLDALYAQGGGG
jgi:long-chain acyl-CoA synthetase